MGAPKSKACLIYRLDTQITEMVLASQVGCTRCVYSCISQGSLDHPCITRCHFILIIGIQRERRNKTNMIWIGSYLTVNNIDHTCKFNDFRSKRYPGKLIYGYNLTTEVYRSYQHSSSITASSCSASASAGTGEHHL